VIHDARVHSRLERAAEQRHRAADHLRAKVSTVLHTPLMSGANAIHGVVLVGAILITGTVSGPVQLTLGTLAIVLGTVNMVGGFVVTDRMLGMFSRPGRSARGGGNGGGAAGEGEQVRGPAR
jgi:NAD(P) transhydrogenase subunit alpha